MPMEGQRKCGTAFCVRTRLIDKSGTTTEFISAPFTVPCDGACHAASRAVTGSCLTNEVREGVSGQVFNMVCDQAGIDPTTIATSVTTIDEYGVGPCRQQEQAPLN